MAVRKLTLTEWFLAFQMRKMVRDHQHLPAFLDIDITDIASKYEEIDGGRPPYVALVVKAAALAGKRVPEINVAYFRTFYGDRILAFESVTVNVPVLLQENGKRQLSIKSVNRADELDVEEIHTQIQAARKKAVGAIKLLRRLAGSSNNFFSRLVLRLLHFFIFNFPAVFEKRGGGGFSVSSILNYDEDAAPVQVPAFGPTAVSISLTALLKVEGRTILRAGAGVDHAIIDGWVARKYTDTLYKILTGKDEASSRALLPRGMR